MGGTHAGKSGIVRDINKSKTGHITITVEQNNGVSFKSLGKNVNAIEGINSKIKKYENKHTTTAN